MYAIRSFVGANGGGKSLAAVALVAIPAWKEGRPVMSNMGLNPAALGFDPDLYVPLTRWEDVGDFHGGSVILDEISSVMPSRSHAKVPPELIRLMNQLRKQDVELAWTAPAWARCDLVLREVTQAVTVCRGSYPDKWRRDDDGTSRWFPRRTRDEHDDPVPVRRAWWPNRLFVWTTFDAFAFDEFSYTKTKELRPLGVRRSWIYRQPARLAYDTLEGVELLDHLRDGPRSVEPEGSPARPPGRQPVNPRRRPEERAQVA